MDLSKYKNKLSDLKNTASEEITKASSVSKHALSKSKDLKDMIKNKVSKSADEIAQRQGKEVARLWNEKAKPIIGGSINDDALVTKAALTVYEFLPVGIRLVLSEEKFVTFALKQRNALVENEKVSELLLTVIVDADDSNMV